ncbi:MAG: insulinase family protein [Gammaproteobacteria bacterium]|nr:insulinase family protein [Gammaproteobacteria bacterium]
MAIFSELRRRNIPQVAFVYVVGAALVYWLGVVVQTQLDLPWWTNRLIATVLVIGLPLALIFAWVYEITPSGLKKAVDVDQTQSIVFKTGQKLNAALAVLVVLAGVAMVADRLLPELAVVEPPPVPERVFDAPVGDKVPAEIRSFTLDNGLQIIVWPDHDIPNVVMYNFIRAGGRNEYPGITGLAHFFEHMMFNGTENLEPGEFDRVMEAAGGANNAYTSNDITAYMDWFPRSALDTIFNLEADRLANLLFTPEVVESERGVVSSERGRRVDNDNFGKLYEQMRATAFVAHPYQFPVLGWPSDIAAWTQLDLETFYRIYYAPNNCTMVFSGDVTPEEIYSLAEEYFADIPAQQAPAAVRTVEPDQLGTRRLTLEAPAQTPLLHMAFHAGSATDPETLPLELLLHILVGGDSSRLHRLLVEELQVAISVGGFQREGFDPSLVYFYLTLPPGGDPAVVEARVMQALNEVATEGVSDAELMKARNIILADFWREMATIDGKASSLGNFEVFHGNYEKLFDLPSDIENISNDALRDVAAKVFRSNNATIGMLIPPTEDAE